MTRAELLARQAALLEALCDSGGSSPVGIDPARLELVGALAAAKRLAKIEAVLPRTCRALGAEFAPLADEFMSAHPAEHFRSRADALAFYRFLRRRWNRAGLRPLHLADLAHCELALTALVGASADRAAGPDWNAARGGIAIRRIPGVRLRACAFNLQKLFQADGSAEVPIDAVRTHLAIVADPLVGAPRIIALSASMFRFLSSVRRWCIVEESGDEQTTALLAACGRSGLLEMVQRPR
jgi:hypothetical protein